MVASSASSTFYSPGNQLAVLIAIGKANDKGHTSVVYGLEVHATGDLQTEESLQVIGKPFRLHDDIGHYIWCNHKLREKNLRVGSVIQFISHNRRRPEMRFSRNTTVKMVSLLFFLISLKATAHLRKEMSKLPCEAS